MDVGKIAGGYEFGSPFGSQKDLTSLHDYCRDSGIDLFVDFDVIRFNRSGNGFSSVFDSAKSANYFTAYQNFYSVALRNVNSQYARYVLLKRSKLPAAVDKLIETAHQYKLNGLSLSSLSNLAYSDYDEKSFYVRGEFEKQVRSELEKIKREGLSFMASDANGYAASMAQKIVDVPVYSALYDVLDVDVPAYQMVFKGMVDTAVSPVNTAVSVRDQFLKALEGGSGLSFSLIGTYDTDFAVTRHSATAVSLFEDNRDLITSMVKESKDYYKAIRGASIKKHVIMDNGLRYTEFDNGVSILINYSTKSLETPDGTVPSKGFHVKR